MGNKSKKYIAIIASMAITISMASCSLNEKVDHKFYSQKGVEKALSKVITEEFEVVRCIDDTASKHIWECKLPDRDNLTFKVYNTIEDDAEGKDGFKAHAGWYNKIDTDYGVAIKENSDSVVRAYAEKYGLQLDDSNYEQYHLYTIKIKSKDQLDDLINFYVDVDNLYAYCTKDADIANTDIVDYITFEKEGVTIESIKWSTKDKERFTKNSVRETIVKRFNSKASAEDVITGAGKSTDSIIPDIDIPKKIDDVIPDLDEVIPSKNDIETKISEQIPDVITDIPETDTTTAIPSEDAIAEINESTE